MNRFQFIIFSLLLGSWQLHAQTNYTSYFTGNPSDVEVSPLGGSVLMGGAGENDQAMIWFLERANGGDVLVLRASGSDGYNDYLYSELGVTVNSVETIVFQDGSAASEPYIIDKINKAEAIWFAGGDQWNYVSYWRGTEVATSINEAVGSRNAVIGGISAGMAIMGSFYFSAENGTVTSSQALNNPFHPNVTVSQAPFLDVDFLTGVITDTHYDDPDRKGRHTVFMSRMFGDAGVNPRGIASDEFTAICIDPDGLARVFGEYPSFDDNAYFIHTNCNLGEYGPEFLADGSPLTWDRDGQALYVYQVKGTESGENTFDLSTWQSGSGGAWKVWSVDDGVFAEADSDDPACNPLDLEEFTAADIRLYPNPAADHIKLQLTNNQLSTVQVFDIRGIALKTFNTISSNQLQINTSGWASGVYFLQITDNSGNTLVKRFIKS